MNVRPAENPSPDELSQGIHSFVAWLEGHGYASYDPYDVWGTTYGRYARRLYYRKSPLGYPLIAPILILENLVPQWRRLIVNKSRSATADAQLLLAYANLYEFYGDKRYLERAEELAKDLLGYSVRGYSGPCWGYPFDWQHHRGLWQKNTPFITSTPYCFEGFLRLFDLTGDSRYFSTARSIAEFVQKDLRDTSTSPDAAAGSYSPSDNSQVINASAYRAMVLFEAAARFDRPDYLTSARKNLNFILQSQQADGSWLYALDHPAERFIDHFHTCFNLKNLAKLNRRLQDAAVTTSIKRGFEYYRTALFDSNGLPKQFAIKPRKQIVRLEMYDFAESITLGATIRETCPAALEIAQRLAHVLISKYQMRAGHFATRVYRGGRVHTMPFLRWPQAQLFYSLTNLLLATQPPQSKQPIRPSLQGETHG